MRTANNTNNYTVEGLVAKYRNFVKDNIADLQWELGRRISFRNENNDPYILVDDRIITSDQVIDFKRVLNYLMTIFPGCDADLEFVDSLSSFCLNGESSQIDRYMSDTVKKCRADYQLLAKLYQIVAADSARNEVLDILSDYAKIYKSEAFSSEEFEFLCQNFSGLVSYEFEHEAEWFHTCEEDSRYQINDDSPLSSWIIKYLKEKLTVYSGKTVYALNSGYGEIAQCFENNEIYGTGFAGLHWALGQVFVYAMTGIHSRIVSFSDFTMPKEDSVDLIVYDAIDDINGFGFEWDFNRLYASLKEGGRMVIFATREGTRAPHKNGHHLVSKNWLLFLHRLVEEKAIESIITTEKDIHRAKSMVVGDLDDILLFVEKKMHSTVQIESRKSRKTANVRANDLEDDLLWPSYYLTERPNNGCPLGTLAKGIEDFSFRLPSEKELEDRALVVNLSDLSDSYKDACLDSKALQPIAKSAFMFRNLDPSAVLAYCEGGKLVVGYQTQGRKLAAKYNVPCLLPRPDIDTRYLVAILLSSEVKRQILSICDGLPDAFGTQLILDRIIVPKHTPKERLQFLAEANYDALLSVQQEMKKNHEDYKKAVRMRKHALTQSLSSIEAMFYALDAYRLRQNGNLSDADVISRRKGTTVKEAFEFIEPNLKNMMVTLEHIADVEYSFDNPQMIDPERFIEAYVAQKESGWLNFKPIINWKKGNNQFGNDVRDPETGNMIAYADDPISVLYFSKDAFKRVLDNVVANAIAHGFTDSNRNDYKLRFSWHTDGMNLVVVVENNGTAIPADRDTASLLEYGVSGALHHDGHNGIGCHEIADIMRRYGRSV